MGISNIHRLLVVLVTAFAVLPTQAQEPAATAAEPGPATGAASDATSPREGESESSATTSSAGTDAEDSDKSADDATAPDAKPESAKTKKKPHLTDAVIVEPAPAPQGTGLQLRYSSVSVIRVNPLGLISDNLIGGRFRLYESDNALLKDNYIGLALAPTLSGGFIRGGFLAELQPVSVMRLWARFDLLNYYGIFSVFQSFDDPSSDFSDSRISELGGLEAGDPKRNYSTWGTQVTLGLDLKIKVGPVAARSLSRLVRSDFRMRTGDRVFYDQVYDTLAPNQGLLFTNDTDLLGYFDLSFLNLLQGMRVVAGFRNTVTAPLYSDIHFAPNNPDRGSEDLLRRTFGDNGPIWRAGPLVSFTFFDDPGALFNKPTVFMAAQWHILHRWRTGADVSQLIPYTFLGFAVSGDFLG